MDLITLSFSKNYIWAGLSTLGLGAITYFANRYNNNTAETTNQTYYKPIEAKNYNGNININIINKNNTINVNKPITYIFWNGDVGSTYLIIDLLLQDKIVQPLYIERYTIIRALEGERLISIVYNKKNSFLEKSRTKNIDENNNTKFLKQISSLKRSQDYEIKQLEMLRLMILGQYPEFRNNFLPTTYISTIAKDLEYTSQFYNTLKDISPGFCDGIEFIEQVMRFLKHYNNILEGNSNSNININNNIVNKHRIILGCNKEYKNIDLLLKLKNKSLIVGIDFPIIDMDVKTVKFMAVEFFPNDIMKYFLQVEKGKEKEK
jgi:hypothetical protein